jgi:transposase-like protein
MARRSYTQEQRAEALKLYQEVGPSEAGRRLDIPNATIRQWAKRAGASSARAEHVAAAVRGRATGTRTRVRREDLAPGQRRR